MRAKSRAWAAGSKLVAHDLSKLSIRRACIENAASPSPRTASEIAAELGVPAKRVHEAMSRLRGAGRLRPSSRQFTRVAARSESEPDGVRDDVLDAAVLLEDLAAVEVLTTHERRQVLSRLARNAPTPVRVSAVRALEELDRQTGKQVGPPEPMDDAELTERVATMLASVGPEVGRVAMKHALAVWKRERRPEWFLDGMAASGQR